MARSLLTASRETGDAAARTAGFDRMHALFLQDVPAVVLFNSARIAACRANVVGYRGWPAAQQRLWGVGFR